MTYHWFGDSWVCGDELDNVQNSFPYLVSKHFNIDFKIHAERASSIPHLIVQLKNALPQIKPNDVLFFGLSGHDRFFVIDDDGESVHLLQSFLIDSQWIKHPIILEIAKAWYKYFDNKKQRIHNVSCTLDIIKSYTQKLNCKLWFYNLFTVPEHDCYLVDSEDWLIDPKTCLAEEILHVFDNESGTVIHNDQPSILSQQWEIQKPLIDKYFKPNVNHPNRLGHEMLSKRIINEITAR